MKTPATDSRIIWELILTPNLRHLVLDFTVALRHRRRPDPGTCDLWRGRCKTITRINNWINGLRCAYFVQNERLVKQGERDRETFMDVYKEISVSIIMNFVSFRFVQQQEENARDFGWFSAPTRLLVVSAALRFWPPPPPTVPVEPSLIPSQPLTVPSYKKQTKMTQLPTQSTLLFDRTAKLTDLSKTSEYITYITYFSAKNMRI